MKYIILFILVTILISSNLTFGQINVQGKISNEASLLPVQFATVTLHAISDSTMAKAALSDTAGKFTLLNIEPGKYFLKISSIGYQEFIQTNFDLTASKTNIELGELKIRTDEKQLAELVVKADRPVFEQKLGMTVVHVDSKMFKTATNALDVLKRSPGLIIDNSGNIKFRGVAPKVLVDGRDLQMSDEQQKNYLKTLTPEMIENIELISNPSVRYESSYNTIINIILKRDKNLGIKGSLNATYENNGFLNQNLGTNLTYKTKKMGYSLVLSEYQNFWYQNLQQNRTINNGDTEDKYLLKSFLSSPSKGISYNIGIEYILAKHHTLDFRLSGDKSISDGNQNSDVKITLAGKEQPFSNSKTKIYEKPIANTGIIGYKFKNASSELIVELGITKKRKPGTLNMITEYQINNELLPYVNGQKNTNYSGSDFKTINLMWSTQKIKNWKIESGAKINYINNIAQISYDTLKANISKLEAKNYSNYIRDNDRSNDFTFNENIAMGYVQAGRSFKKLSFEAGLRIENTQTRGKSMQSDSSVNRNYYNWLPSVNFSYPANEKNSFNFGMSRKLSRPTVWQLNPFPFVIDPYTYAIGNPFLFPRIRNKAELNYSYNNKLQVSVNKAYIQNMVSQITIYNPINKTVAWVQVNTNGNNTGFDVSYTDKINKIWNYMVYANLNFGSETYNNNGKPIKQAGKDGYFYFQNTFTLPKSFTLELSGYYAIASNSGLYVSKPAKSLDLTLQKSFLKGKINTNLSMRDIFYTSISRFEININNTNMSVINKGTSRSFNARISYNFGKSTYGGQNRKSSVSEDSNRL